MDVEFEVGDPVLYAGRAGEVVCWTRDQVCIVCPSDDMEARLRSGSRAVPPKLVVAGVRDVKLIGMRRQVMYETTFRDEFLPAGFQGEVACE